MTWKQHKEEWVRFNTCGFCPGSHMHTCTSFQCQPAYEKAEEYFENVIAKEEAAMEYKYFINLSAYFKRPKTREVIEGVWIIINNRKKELVIRFRDEVLEMLREVFLSMAVQGLESVTADTEEKTGKNSDIYILLDGMLVREWKEDDEEENRYIINVEPNKI